MGFEDNPADDVEPDREEYEAWEKRQQPDYRLASTQFYFFERLPDGLNPAGITVSKTPQLPEGGFKIDEFSWPAGSLWFIADHDFTADERQAAFDAFLKAQKETR
jgi:hypothetical protein